MDTQAKAPTKYIVDEQPNVKKLLGEGAKLQATAAERRAEVEQLRTEAQDARKKAEALDALAALGEETQATADKADEAADKAEAKLDKAVKRLQAVTNAQNVLDQRLKDERAKAQAEVDARILADLRKLTQEVVDATERATELHAQLADLDIMASNHSNIPALKLRNYMPGFAGGQTSGDQKISLSVTEEWICKVRGRGLAKSSQLEKRWGGLVDRTIERYGGTAA